MKSVSKQTKRVTLCVILTLVFLCIFNVVYSYFTATANLNGNLEFNSLLVNFTYLYDSDLTIVNNSNTLILYPTSTYVVRGQVFEVTPVNGGSTAIDAVSVKLQTGSCNSYVRYWIDAYIVNDGVVDESTNYGRYFILGTKTTTNGVDSVVVNSTYFDTVSYKGLVTYYIKDVVTTSVSPTIFNAIQLDVDAPSVLYGNDVQLSVSLEAVQAVNDAYVSAFNDSSNPNYRGSYNGWAQ